MCKSRQVPSLTSFLLLPTLAALLPHKFMVGCSAYEVELYLFTSPFNIKEREDCRISRIPLSLPLVANLHLSWIRKETSRCPPGIGAMTENKTESVTKSVAKDDRVETIQTKTAAAIAIDLDIGLETVAIGVVRNHPTHPANAREATIDEGTVAESETASAHADARVMIRDIDAGTTSTGQEIRTKTRRKKEKTEGTAVA